MNAHLPPARSLVLLALRSATGCAHRRLETRLDAIERLACPASREEMVARYADLHLPADAVLGAALQGVPGLDMERRRRSALLAGSARGEPTEFPRPDGAAEALGMLYVLEGSTLGGRMILRALAARGVSDASLRFLDPYGGETAQRWHDFLAVLARETGDDAGRIERACQGGRRGFEHAERVLCGSAP